MSEVVGNGKRHEIRGLKGRDHYILIDDEPCVMITFPDNNPENWNYQSTATALARIISVAMQHGVPCDMVKKQLKESSMQEKDTPSVLLEAMEKHKW